MKELKIEVPHGYEIDKAKSTFEKIIFKKIKDELPNTWGEFCEQNYNANKEYFIGTDSDILHVKRLHVNRSFYGDRNLLSTKEDAEAHLALIQLHRLRDVYRQGWKPNWDDNKEKYCINYFECKVEICALCCSRHFLSFQSQEIAEKFLKNFKDLIEKAKELL